MILYTQRVTCLVDLLTVGDHPHILDKTMDNLLEALGERMFGQCNARLPFIVLQGNPEKNHKMR